MSFNVTLDLTFSPTTPKPTTATKDGVTTVTWTIDRPPMLPGQGFLLKWTTKGVPHVSSPTPAKADATDPIKEERPAAELPTDEQPCHQEKNSHVSNKKNSKTAMAAARIDSLGMCGKLCRS